MKIPRTLPGLLAHTDPLGDCLVWRGAKNLGGYGYVWEGGRQKKVHRMVAELRLGPPAAPLAYVLHSCDRPPCINPDHLRYGTQADNVSDMVTRGRHRGNTSGNRRGYRKTACVHGHAMEGANLHVLPDGTHRCRRCQAENARRYRSQKRVTL